MRVLLLVATLSLWGAWWSLASDSGGLSWEMHYDEEGRVSEMRDPAGRGTRIAYEKHPQGGIRQATLVPPAGPQVGWRFGEGGRLEEMTDGEGSVRYRYDAHGRLAAVSRDGASEIRYRYDTLDRWQRMEIGEAAAPYYWIERTYDHLGRLAALDTPAGRIGYEYREGLGEVIRSLPNGVKTIWKRQPNGELEEITHGFFRKPEDTKYSVLAQFTYRHGPEGRIRAIHEATPQTKGERRYTFDKMGRLTDATAPGGQAWHYEYDLAGNRTKATAPGRPDQLCAYDWAGRLTSVNGQPCRYDANGNLSEVTLDGVTRHYRFHPDSRLAEARVGDESVQYRYDGYGRLVARQTAAGETRFIPDPLSPIWQPLVVMHAHGGQTLVIWDRDAPLGLVENTATQWMLHDHLGSTRTVTDGQGSVRENRNLDPNGLPDNWPEADSIAPGFAGLYADGVARAIHTLSRCYVPALGLFLQPDPKQSVDSSKIAQAAMFTYCGGDGMNYVDRNGYEREWAGRERAFDPFLQELNGTYAHFSDAAALGLGSGEEALTEAGRQKILSQAGGRFQVIDTTASGPGGGSADLGEYILTGGRHWDGTPIRATWTSELVFKHSGGAHLDTPSATKIFLGDPSAQKALPQAEITFPDAVAGVTAVELQRVSKDAVGIGFRGKFGSNPLEGVAEVGRDILGFARGIGMVARNVAQHGKPWFTHNLTIYRDKLVNAGALKPEGTYRETQMVTRSGVYHYSSPEAGQAYRLIRITERPTEPTPPRQELPSPSPPQRGGGSASVSFVASANPLSKQDRLAWEAMKAQQNPGKSPGGGIDSGGGSQSLAASRGGISPSNVGGVYLGGAGGALRGLGMLAGVRVGADGNLVLVGKGGGDVKLPPLRLEDVVTVFRSVFLHGEGPTVTIDPNPDNPEKSAMIIRHNEATENTYVGWVLYQADRLMKGYTLGVDNITKQDVVSAVPGFQEMVDKMYFGGDDPRQRQKGGRWERFWIVPAEIRRFDGPRQELTLLDAPLKARTQTMKWEKGKLVDDLAAQSSPGATGFTSWFTSRYDEIASEQYLQPPVDSGLTEPVPVFTELRRIALMTAMAEKLREDGVSFPHWMREFEVREVTFEKTTPGLEVTRMDARHVARIFGGVQLSPADKDVQSYTATSDLAKIPEARRPEVSRQVKLAEGLAKALGESEDLQSSLPLKLARVAHEGQEYQAIAMPGAETLALNPCRLDEVDVAVAFGGGRSLQLVRSFHSFFHPKGPWGRGWALDLPRLDKIRVPGPREDGKSTYSVAYELVGSLEGAPVTFDRVSPVAALGGAKLMTPRGRSDFLGLAAHDKTGFLPVPTWVAYAGDGRRMHFTEAGDLAMVEHDGERTVYERDAEGRVSKIIALLGRNREAEIALQYRKDGLLESATGKNASGTSTVRYEYDARGKLAAVRSGARVMGYRYDGSLVTEIFEAEKAEPSREEKPKVVRTFRYNEHGQLLAESVGDGPTTDYRLAQTAAERRVTVVGGGAESSTRYDERMRPVEWKAADGSRTDWKYAADGGVEETVHTPGASPLVVRTSGDGTTREVGSEDGVNFAARYDSAGRLLAVSEAGAKGARPILEQKWDGAGPLRERTSEGARETFAYDADGLLARRVVEAKDAKQARTQWQETKLDRYGRATQVKDGGGLDVAITYEVAGQIAAVVQRDAQGKKVGCTIERDAEGRAKAMKSSWGDAEWRYGAGGELEGLEYRRGNERAQIALAGGRVRKVTQFDGGEMQLAWAKGDADRLERVQCANGLEVAYTYPDERSVVAEVAGVRKVSLSYDEATRVLRYSLAPTQRGAVAAPLAAPVVIPPPAAKSSLQSPELSKKTLASPTPAQAPSTPAPIQTEGVRKAWRWLIREKTEEGPK